MPKLNLRALLIFVLSIASLSICHSVSTKNDNDTVELSDFPQEDLPGESQKYKPGESYKFYYGIKKPLDYKQARFAAFAEFEQGDSYVFGGSSILMMLYANGFGVKKNLDLSIKLARLRVGFAPAEIESRIAHLEALKTSPEDKPFDLCDDISSGFMGGHCASIASEKEAATLERDLRLLTEKWNGEHKEAYNDLTKYVDDFNSERVHNEVDLTGTLRAAFQIEEESKLRSFFKESLFSFEKGDPPQYTQTDFVGADKKLNRVYSKLRHSNSAFEYGTIKFEGVQKVQRKWVKYRDAWVRFGAIRYPQVSSYSWKTWLTKERIKQLEYFEN